MEDEVVTKLDSVTNCETFLVFVRALVADRRAAVEQERVQPSSPYGSDQGGWENVSIENYLDAALSWAESSDLGLTSGLSQNNPWSRFANFLYMGKIYE